MRLRRRGHRHARRRRGDRDRVADRRRIGARPMRPVAIFRFSPTEGPGHFGAWLARHEVPQRLIAIDQGDNVPTDPRAFSGIAMMGGPMSANEDPPWNAPLMALLDAAMHSEIPVLGHCLGGQLLAKALG